MMIRHAKKADLNRIMEIYAIARAYMASHGNPDQWGPTNWPPESLIREDIDNAGARKCAGICKKPPAERIAGKKHKGSCSIINRAYYESHVILQLPFSDSDSPDQGVSRDQNLSVIRVFP